MEIKGLNKCQSILDINERLKELREKDINYSKENNIDELAVQFLKIIKYCKEEIEK